MFSKKFNPLCTTSSSSHIASYAIKISKVKWNDSAREMLHSSHHMKPILSQNHNIAFSTELPYAFPLYKSKQQQQTTTSLYPAKCIGTCYTNTHTQEQNNQYAAKPATSSPTVLFSCAPQSRVSKQRQLTVSQSTTTAHMMIVGLLPLNESKYKWFSHLKFKALE